jgi:hypothetical protein
VRVLRYQSALPIDIPTCLQPLYAGFLTNSKEQTNVAPIESD